MEVDSVKNKSYFRKAIEWYWHRYLSCAVERYWMALIALLLLACLCLILLNILHQFLKLHHPFFLLTNIIHTIIYYVSHSSKMLYASDCYTLRIGKSLEILRKGNGACNDILSYDIPNIWFYVLKTQNISAMEHGQFHIRLRRIIDWSSFAPLIYK